MNLQYISDNKGKTTGVFVPIKDWQYLKEKYKGIEKEEKNSDIPQWHKDIIDQRMDNYKKNPESYRDWDDLQKEINQKYGL